MIPLVISYSHKIIGSKVLQDLQKGTKSIDCVLDADCEFVQIPVKNVLELITLFKFAL